MCVKSRKEMRMNKNVVITQTIPFKQKNRVASLFYRAFDKKFSAIWFFANNELEAVRVLKKSIHFQDGFYALSDDEVIGFVGVERGERYYTQLNFGALMNVYSMFGSVWRYLAYGIYRLFQGKTDKNTIHIDPIVVSSESRGMGVGTKLIEAVCDYAKQWNKKRVILEVVDTNPRAQKLYEKMGFQVVDEENTSLLTSRAGFDKVYHMEKIIV